MNETVMTAVGICIGMLLVGIGSWYRVHMDRRLKVHGSLIMAAGYVVMMITAILIHSTASASVHAALAAWFLYEWWNGGGGDGIRRLAKKLRSLTMGRALPQAT